MIKKLLIFSSILTISSVIQAQETHNNKAYLDMGVGLNFASDREREGGNSDYKRHGDYSFNGFGAFGYKISQNFIIQAGAEYHFNNEYTQKAFEENGKKHEETISKMKIFVPKMSLFLNHHLNEYFDLYVGGGIGSAMFSSMEALQKDKNVKFDDKTNFYWSVDAGMIFHITDSFDMGLGYNYGNFGKISDPYDPVIMNTIKTSLRFNF
jgi:opacity protein-like surface antigen